MRPSLGIDLLTQTLHQLSDCLNEMLRAHRGDSTFDEAK
jgi:hypothetical protein